MSNELTQEQKKHGVIRRFELFLICSTYYKKVEKRLLESIFITKVIKAGGVAISFCGPDVLSHIVVQIIKRGRTFVYFFEFNIEVFNRFPKTFEEVELMKSLVPKDTTDYDLIQSITLEHFNKVKYVNMNFEYVLDNRDHWKSVFKDYKISEVDLDLMCTMANARGLLDKLIKFIEVNPDLFEDELAIPLTVSTRGNKLDEDLFSFERLINMIKGFNIKSVYHTSYKSCPYINDAGETVTSAPMFCEVINLAKEESKKEFKEKKRILMPPTSPNPSKLLPRISQFGGYA